MLMVNASKCGVSNMFSAFTCESMWTGQYATQAKGGLSLYYINYYSFPPLTLSVSCLALLAVRWRQACLFLCDKVVMVVGGGGGGKMGALTLAF